MIETEQESLLFNLEKRITRVEWISYYLVAAVTAVLGQNIFF
jgi:hypothetical protein